ncbi:BTB/POZ domain-containing protein At5g47800-like isoform X2 [Salvia splendens]|uniref:BTB/POZ domain-containing protein At5g47800-like isoform X2 n=1 Tax=Salvia splendens TaxID=180675 RepID=UPI001C253F36|nr:BTB/POZ domain-containing protein At5g47800-like isoform X2 [Salvia splendens]
MHSTIILSLSLPKAPKIPETKFRVCCSWLIELSLCIRKMKFMKLGSRPDTFFTEEATRAVMSDVPSDLTIKINNISYLLHKYPLLPKCGLLQRLYSEADDATLELHDIPGGGEAFELCAKYCYGITINLSAHNLVPSLCAAKFLRMTEAVEPGNLLIKLDSFFSSCILQSWKDSIVTLNSTYSLFDWSQSLGIVRRCIDSIVDKILTPPNKVTWSYTYTRPGYDKTRRHQSVPRDWWTEDVSFLNVDMFRCILAAIKSANALQPQLIGEALHVYASRWMPEIARDDDEASTSREDEAKRRLLETVVSLIPAERGSVSFRFLLRLLSFAKVVAASPATKAELLRVAGQQLEEATLNDLLLLPGRSGDESLYDVELIQTVLESFLRQWKRQVPIDERESMKSICKIGKLIDYYLQVVARDAGMTVQKMTSLAETLPGIARPDHDHLYKAINIYLKEHPDLSKADKKQLCRVLDCQKLSPEICGHAVRNERLPLRTVVQVLYYEHEKANSNACRKQASPDETERGVPSTSRVHEKSNLLRPEPSFKVRGEVAESKNGRASVVELNSREKALIRRISHKSHS